MDTLTDSEDTNEMQHNAAFHLGLHCLLRLTQPSRTKIHQNFENSTFESIKYTMDSAILYKYLWENPLGYKRFMHMHTITSYIFQDGKKGPKSSSDKKKR